MDLVCIQSPQDSGVSMIQGIEKSKESEMEVESCTQCDMDTGKTGDGEGSLYFGDEGPLCEDCLEFMESKFKPWKKIKGE